MPVKTISVDIFKTSAHILVNPVNCIGVMGKGLALQFKKRYPTMFKAYKKACDNKQINLCTVDWYIPDDLKRIPIIVNFPTKYNWRDKSEEHAIREGLFDLSYCVELIKQPCIIAMPALGCGLGGLPFPMVKGHIKETFKNSIHTILICLHKGKK